MVNLPINPLVFRARSQPIFLHLSRLGNHLECPLFSQRDVHRGFHRHTRQGNQLVNRVRNHPLNLQPNHRRNPRVSQLNSLLRFLQHSQPYNQVYSLVSSLPIGLLPNLLHNLRIRPQVVRLVNQAHSLLTTLPQYPRLVHQ